MESERKEKVSLERLSMAMVVWDFTLFCSPLIYCIWIAEEAFIKTPDKLTEAINTAILFALGWVVLLFLLILGGFARIARKGGFARKVEKPLTLVDYANIFMTMFMAMLTILTFNTSVTYLYLWNRFPDINEFEPRFTLSISLFAAGLYISSKIGSGLDFREVFFGLEKPQKT